jgi:hypothetical protein
MRRKVSAARASLPFGMYCPSSSFGRIDKVRYSSNLEVREITPNFRNIRAHTDWFAPPRLVLQTP